MPDASPRPLVSVVIPAYRRVETIRRALDSALHQTMPDLEIIVVDDASGDGTAELVAAIPDERVRLLVHPVNRGGNAARQTGIEAARGTWIAFLDSDDVWEPTKLGRQIERLTQAGDGYGLCYTWYDIELSDGSFRPPREVYVEGLRRPELVREHAVGTFSTMVVSKAALESIGGLDLGLPACQDWDMVFRINQVTAVCVVPEVLVHYWHGDGDPHRISTRKASVVEGHRLVYQKIRTAYPDMPADAVAASQHYVMAAFAQQGAVQDVLRVIADMDRRTLSGSNARLAAHMVARAGRKRLRARS